MQSKIEFLKEIVCSGCERLNEMVNQLGDICIDERLDDENIKVVIKEMMSDIIRWKSKIISQTKQFAKSKDDELYFKISRDIGFIKIFYKKLFKDETSTFESCVNELALINNFVQFKN